MTADMTDLEKRRKKLTFRARHRGMKELDIILGNFAEQNLSTLDDAQLTEFEALLHVPDQDMYAILVNGGAVPDALNGPLFQSILTFAQDPLGNR